MGAVLMDYFSELCRAMEKVSEKPKALFIGQGVAHAGTTMTDTLKNVPNDKLVEFPVAEELQLGASIGLSMQGWLPICIYPRWNFMLRAADQIVNHLDRLPIYSDGGYIPKVIIRTAIPKVHPFNPGPQHDDDFTDAFKIMLRTVNVVRLESADEIVPAYIAAISSQRSSILVEYTDKYSDVIPSANGRN